MKNTFPVGRQHVMPGLDAGHPPFTRASASAPACPAHPMAGSVRCPWGCTAPGHRSDTRVRFGYPDKDPVCVNVIHKVEVASQPVDGHLFDIWRVGMKGLWGRSSPDMPISSGAPSFAHPDHGSLSSLSSLQELSQQWRILPGVVGNPSPTASLQRQVSEYTPS